MFILFELEEVARRLSQYIYLQKDTKKFLEFLKKDKLQVLRRILSHGLIVYPTRFAINCKYANFVFPFYPPPLFHEICYKMIVIANSCSSMNVKQRTMLKNMRHGYAFADLRFCCRWSIKFFHYGLAGVSKHATYVM